MAAYSCDWSELHPDLLVQIFSSLQLVDFIRAAAACRSWRQLKLKSKDFHVRPNNQIPWLMLSSPSPSLTQSRYFHSLLPSSGTHEIRLPEIAGLSCIGSSQGFLISPDQATADLRVINPVTGAHIPLPPTSTIPDIDDLNIQEFWFSKAILSPDLSFGVRPWTAAVIYSSGDLAFARPGDGKWTLIADSPVLCVYDILFHKNMLHAVSFTGALAAFDLWDPSVPHSLLCEGLPSEKIRHIKCYLVESPDGNDLYYVTRYIGLFSPNGDGDGDDQEGEYEDAEEDCQVDDEYDDEDDDDVHRTTNFWVYKLDELGRQWIEVNTLGDLALFLGFNHPLALSAMEHPGIKRNSIYFTDDYKERYFDRPEFASRDMGVFDVGDGSIRPLSLGDDLLCLNWPPPIWFTPTLS